MTTPRTPESGGWQVLAVDDEPLALNELMHLLGRSPHVAEVTGARNGVDALRLLKGTRFDVVFLDVNMPQLDGVELATVLAALVDRPLIVFVTAYENRAAEAYALDAVDYVLKPLRPERIEDALQRVGRRLAGRVAAEPAADRPPDDLAAIAVDDGRRTFFVRREDVLFAEAHRDYVHLHTVGVNPGVHTVRIPLSVLETSWAEHGFLRVHRSYLVALRHVSELGRDPLGGHVVRVAGNDLPVSRRQAALLRERVHALLRRGETPKRSP
jgi:DNA-binding LytR/AlgR family response regulator